MNASKGDGMGMNRKPGMVGAFLATILAFLGAGPAVGQEATGDTTALVPPAPDGTTPGAEVGPALLEAPPVVTTVPASEPAPTPQLTGNTPADSHTTGDTGASTSAGNATSRSNSGASSSAQSQSGPTGAAQNSTNVAASGGGGGGGGTSGPVAAGGGAAVNVTPGPGTASATGGASVATGTAGGGAGGGATVALTPV
ncbi:MAG: hypothetical protein AB1673_06760, partial [Actinomycetota bacterium]